MKSLKLKEFIRIIIKLSNNKNEKSKVYAKEREIKL